MDDHRPPVIIGQRDIVSVMMLVLMLFANLGIKLYFKQRNDQLQLAKLEKQNLEQQLEYLKYQLNPHFLMNTLNNIHALVDIDPELSKASIVELSKMLRFVLYEGNKPTVPLCRELDFLDHYITLMRLRYTDKVSITVSKPDELPNCEIPPLIFITFVENAFKHGVSYQQLSFIDISIEIAEGRLKFYCRNSKIPDEEDKHGGVGLQNVKQRLELIYGKNFTLDINDEPQEYNIQLTIPL
jgi:LytS/YehU family sensor histidine kinase